MPKHILGRATRKPANSARPLGVFRWRSPTLSRPLPDTLASRFEPLLVDRHASDETELITNSLKTL